MVGSAPQSQSQPPSAEEEALRRNTDCVYFLASPLTCKKGSECEYRHSDNARLNPRDCWYWLNGNCLNPKCAFRHPPLDGLLGTPTSSGSSAHVPLNVSAPPAAPATNVSTKQPVACIYFQKGFCIKGDWCPFLHGPNSIGNKPLLVTGIVSAAEPAAMTKRVFNGIEISLQGKKVFPANSSMNTVKSGKESRQVNPITEMEPAPQGNEFALNRKVMHSADIPGYRTAPLVSNGIPVSWPSRVQHSQLLEEPETVYGKATEEVSREPSPGFDVLVDDEGRDSDYYPSEDRYGMSMENEARNESDMDHSVDHIMIAAVDDERYRGSLGYDSNDLRMGGQYAWEQHRASSERISEGSYFERRSYDRPDSSSRVDESDLRHRLARNRNPNGLRSVINRDHSHDRQVRDREHCVPLPEKSLSSRLRGRVRLPRRSSSPVRAGASSHQGRIQNRINERVEEAFNNGGKNHRGIHSRKETVREDSADFTGPKSLAELKNRKHSEPIKQQVTDQQSFGKRKHLMFDVNQQSGTNLSFEGPKPLEEILKRKRGEPIRNTCTIINSSNSQGVAEVENRKAKNEFHGSVAALRTDVEDNKQATLSSPEQPIPCKLEAGEDKLSETQLDQETEVHGDKYGEPDYDAAGGEEFELYDGENVDGSAEDVDEEDDDDDEFAKKMGVMYS